MLLSAEGVVRLRCRELKVLRVFRACGISRRHLRSLGCCKSRVQAWRGSQNLLLAHCKTQRIFESHPKPQTLNPENLIQNTTHRGLTETRKEP